MLCFANIPNIQSTYYFDYFLCFYIKEMIENIKSIKRFQKRKIDQKYQSRKKFSKKTGGAINVPIYRSIPQGKGEDICTALTALNQTISEKDQTKIKTLITENLPEKLKATLPIYDFKKVIYSMCRNIDEPHTFFNDSSPILLVDSNNNYVHSNYTNLFDGPHETYLFRMTSRYQIEYLGKVEKVDYPLYNFHDLYKENYQYTKDTYWINTLQALDRLHPSNFYNIVNFEYEYGTVEPKKKKTIKLVQKL